MIKKRRAFIFFMLLALSAVVNAKSKSNEFVSNKQAIYALNFSIIAMNVDDSLELNLIDFIQSETIGILQADGNLSCYGGGVDPQIPGGDLAFNEFVQEIDIFHIDLCQ